MNQLPTISYHSHHSPMGAHSSFTLGRLGSSCGMATEKGSAAESSVYIGYRTASGETFSFPFFKEMENEAERFSQSDENAIVKDHIFTEDEIKREYKWATDQFKAPGISFSVFTPFGTIPDPDSATQEELKFSCCPGTIIEITVENNSDQEWELYFAHHGSTPWMPFMGSEGLKGAHTQGRMGFASTDDDLFEFIDFSVDKALSREHTNAKFLLAPVAGLAAKVASGARRTVRIAVGYFIGEDVTFNYKTQYWYKRYFSSLSEVLTFSLAHADKSLELATVRDNELSESGLNSDQQFLLAHATRSYYGSTQWLDNGRPVWVVNEGEYLMINTLDLTVDMLFFELRYNPWTVRNVLEHFATRYAYHDQIFSPDAPEHLHEGGLSFTHDMGVGNVFSPEKYSCYECGGIDRECFSYMTCEQLTNWILCAGVYWVHTKDNDFIQKYKSVLLECLQSLLNRDNPDPLKRNGLMSYDSSRTDGGGEITTYDSLDHSLGQARNNIYLAGKCWASYLALEHIFSYLSETDAASEALAGARRCADSLTAGFDDNLGYLPAVLEEGNESAIIPAVEALIYPYKMGLVDAVSSTGPYGGYIEMLKKHLSYVLKPGVCLYEDGAWKLSSSADNSWASKICLNQFVVRHILKVEYDGSEEADPAHVRWQVYGSSKHACSDQFASGLPIGSLYYPRIVTSILWLDES